MIEMIEMEADKSFERDSRIIPVEPRSDRMILAGDRFKTNESMARALEGRKLAHRSIVEQGDPGLVGPSEMKPSGPTENKDSLITEDINGDSRSEIPKSDISSDERKPELKEQVTENPGASLKPESGNEQPDTPKPIPAPTTQPDPPANPAPDNSNELPHLGAGWYQLPDGRKIHGKEAAQTALDEMKKPQPNV